MQLADKIVLAHKGYFSKESEKIYRENSREVCAVSSRKDYISIIELDVRKSKDGMLYCYHGTPIEHCFALKFPRAFSNLRERHKVNSLQEVLDVITEDKTVFLDLKSGTITKDDILAAFEGRKYKEVILGNKSVSFLKNSTDCPRGL